jgi:Flp pilus assembly protein TadB
MLPKQLIRHTNVTDQARLIQTSGASLPSPRWFLVGLLLAFAFMLIVLLAAILLILGMFFTMVFLLVGWRRLQRKLVMKV